MFDIIEEKIAGASVQHSAMHNRMYITPTEQGDWNTLIDKVGAVAREHHYDKVLSRIPEAAVEDFQSKGYQVEAIIPKLYNGKKAGYFLADYPYDERSQCSEKTKKTIASIKNIARAAKKPPEKSRLPLPNNLCIQELGRNDLHAVADLYKRIYKSPTSIMKTVSRLSRLSNWNHEFFGLFDRGHLIVHAILKPYTKESNVEIMDLATDPDYQGRNLSYYLIQEIKNYMECSGYKTVYSMVRATSYGLNITLSKHGFELAGTLWNHTSIKDNLESMNVWYLN